MDETFPDPGEPGADDELRAGLSALSHLAVCRMDLAGALTKVAEYTASAVPGADGAGLTLLGVGTDDTVVASAPFVAEVEAIQCTVQEGPRITAAAHRRTVRSGSLCSDQQWPRFGARVARLGVRSALSLPLVTDEGVLGAMDVYAYASDAFDDRAVRVAELFAVPAAIAVQNAQVLAEARRLSAQLEVALKHRAVIDQAKGILISRMGCGADEAFDRLRQMSQAESRKLYAVAQHVVDRAMQRARARHTVPPS